MGNMDIYESLRHVPEEAKKQIQGGRLKGFTDINPMWRIKMLTQQFGACGFGWYTEEVGHWTESSNGVVGAFVKIHLYVKSGEEWSKPIVGIGGSGLVSMEKGNLTLSDEAYKMAYTDAISVACKALGMAADVYFEKDGRYSGNGSKYDSPVYAQPPQASGEDGWQQPAKFPKPGRKRIVIGSGAWVKAVERYARGETGLKAKLKETYFWDERTDSAFDDSVTDYKIDNNLK